MKGWRLVKVGYASWKAGDTLPGYQVTLPLKNALISLLVSNSEHIYHHVDDDGCPLARFPVYPEQPTNWPAKVPKDPEDP